jgi:hypothetical protein
MLSGISNGGTLGDRGFAPNKRMAPENSPLRNHFGALVVLDIAAEMDRFGSDRSQSGFSYFTRTSVKLCDCIVAKHELDKLAVLRLHIDRVADDRLRRAFEGALFERRNGSGYFGKQNREYLWKGLPIR